MQQRVLAVEMMMRSVVNYFTPLCDKVLDVVVNDVISRDVVERDGVGDGIGLRQDMSLTVRLRGSGQKILELNDKFLKGEHVSIYDPRYDSDIVFTLQSISLGAFDDTLTVELYG